MKNKFQNFVISSGLYNIYCKFRKYDYYFSYVNCSMDSLEDIPIDYLPYADFFYYIKKYPRLIEVCSKLYASHSAKVRRVKRRAWRMVSNSDCLFLTLTFRDDVLASTSQQTRRTYVARFLKEQCNGSEYVANIDFGDINGREHYHVIFGSDFIQPLAWSFGTCNLLHIRNNPDKIATYINKLSFHSTKDTAGHLIYSRCTNSSKKPLKCDSIFDSLLVTDSGTVSTDSTSLLSLQK